MNDAKNREVIAQIQADTGELSRRFEMCEVISESEERDGLGERERRMRLEKVRKRAQSEQANRRGEADKRQIQDRQFGGRQIHGDSRIQWQCVAVGGDCRYRRSRYKWRRSEEADTILQLNRLRADTRSRKAIVVNWCELARGRYTPPGRYTPRSRYTRQGRYTTRGRYTADTRADTHGGEKRGKGD